VSRGPTPSPSPVVLTAYPTGFATSYQVVADGGPVILQPVPGGLRHDASGTLRADNGTTATYTATWTENRVPAPKTVCGGLTYVGLFTADATALSMDVTFPHWGHASLVATSRVVVFQSSMNGSSPPLCDETKAGTYTFEFTTGPMKQLMKGIWSSSADGRLVFAAARPSPGSSPSGKPS
jgi:hypothetical protein